MSWETWASAVLTGISAPVDSTNYDTLWAWSGAESLPRDRMSWNNPLNSTWYMPGATAMNAVSVWSYLSEADGISATIQTLLGGPGWPAPPPPYYYPVILDHLRRSVPRQQWQDACPNLGLWGTGCGWLNSDYGAVPGVIGGDDLTTDEHNRLFGIYDGMFADPATSAYAAQFHKLISDLVAAQLKALPPGGGTEPPEPAEPKTITLTIPSVPGTATGTIS